MPYKPAQQASQHDTAGLTAGTAEPKQRDIQFDIDNWLPMWPHDASALMCHPKP